ncbi:hypothetical protein [Erysipelothrix anatis]|uniref:hypothetical protein n=1 Tax=Erysipelothrix anatis TaxID=2683713 RepID=UPI0013587ECD|nr:hypothetical protein [Erysipelothrix anatis]
MNQNKPKAPIINADGNIFNLMGIASKALKRDGLHEEAKEMAERIFESSSYTEALSIIQEYVEPVDAEQELENLSYDELDIL